MEMLLSVFALRKAIRNEGLELIVGISSCKASPFNPMTSGFSPNTNMFLAGHLGFRV